MTADERHEQEVFAPRPEVLALLPEASGNDINGFGEAVPRRARPVMWHDPEILAYGDLQRWFFAAGGGLKARGHPVGGTGLFQIVELYLQLMKRFPNPKAQVPDGRVGLAHSIGGPCSMCYVPIYSTEQGGLCDSCAGLPVPVRTRYEILGGRADTLAAAIENARSEFNRQNYLAQLAKVNYQLQLLDDETGQRPA